MIGRSAVDVLMSVRYLLPAKIEGNALRADQKLYNDLIDCIESTEARWPHQSLCTGQSFSKALSAALWYVDPHHHTLRKRGITLPGMFLKFNGYNYYKRKKEKKPKLSQLGLNHHVQQLSDFLSQPWFCRSIYSELRDVTEQLVEGMRKYELYIRENSERASNTHHHTEVIRSPFDNIVMKTIPSTSEIIKSEYSEIFQALDKLPDYEPVFLNDYAPEDHFDRRKWLNDFQLSFTLMLYRYPHGNHLGTMNFAWKVPINFDQTINQLTINRLLKH